MRYAKAKREAKAVEGMRAWAKAEVRANAEIARIATKASERDKIKATVRLLRLPGSLLRLGGGPMLRPQRGRGRGPRRRRRKRRILTGSLIRPARRPRLSLKRGQGRR